MTRKRPWAQVVYQIGTENLFPYVPFAIFALERLFAHMRPPVNGKRPSYGESLSAARIVARIRLC
jgi:hypothetical protein